MAQSVESRCLPVRVCVFVCACVHVRACVCVCVCVCVFNKCYMNLHKSDSIRFATIVNLHILRSTLLRSLVHFPG